MYSLPFCATGVIWNNLRKGCVWFVGFWSDGGKFLKWNLDYLLSLLHISPRLVITSFHLMTCFTPSHNNYQPQRTYGSCLWRWILMQRRTARHTAFCQSSFGSNGHTFLTFLLAVSLMLNLIRLEASVNCHFQAFQQMFFMRFKSWLWLGHLETYSEATPALSLLNALGRCCAERWTFIPVWGVQSETGYLQGHVYIWEHSPCPWHHHTSFEGWYQTVDEQDLVFTWYITWSSKS